MANENFVVRHGLIVCGDVGIDTHLGVSGNTSVGGTLKVDSNTDLNGTLGVCGNTSIAGILKVDNNTDLNGTLDVSGNASVGGTLKVESTTCLAGTLAVSGNSDLNSTLDVASNTSLGGTLVVTNATDINSTLDVSGNTSVGGGLTVTGATDLAGSLEVSGGASFGAGLTVTGTLSAEDIDVSGNVTTSTLTVTNTLSAEDIDVSGNVTTSTLTVLKSASISTTLSLGGKLTGPNAAFTGTVSAEDIDVSGNVTTSTLTVTGATDLNSTLGVCGNTSIAGILKVDNNTDLNGTLDVSGNTSVGGGLTVTGATDLNGTLGVCGNTSLGGTLTVCGNTTTSTLTVGNTLSAEDIDVSGSLSVSGNISAGSATITGTVSAEDIDVSGNVTTSTLTVLKSASISTTLSLGGKLTGPNAAFTGTVSAEDIDVSGNVTTSTLTVLKSASISTTLSLGGKLTGPNAAFTGTVSAEDIDVSGNVTTSTLTVLKSATISADTQVKTRLTVGSGHIGSRDPGFSVIGDADSSPLVVKTSGKGTVFAVLPWDTGITYIASGIYYDDGTWTHSSTDTTNCLFSIGGSQGANWYSSSNSTASWNVASNVSLWNSTAQWDNQLSTNVTYNGNTIWHAGNDGSGSGLDADTVDGQQRDNLGATLATYGTTGGASGRVRCTAPFNTNSSHMFQITISLYGSYTIETYVVGGYMYSTTNQWYSSTCIYTGGGNNSPDIKVGRDSSGKAYISVANRNYMGVRVHNMTRGYYTSVADTYDPWTITIDAGTENSVTPTVYENWHSGNDGSGSGLDADTLDGKDSSFFFKSYSSTTGGWEDSNRNFLVRSGGDAVGLCMDESDGTFGFQLYGNSGSYGFLQSNWGSWDIRKTVNGQMVLKVSGTDYTVYHNGNLPSYQAASTALGYITAATGNYGTIRVDDGRGVTYAGYAIRDDWVFMSSGASVAGIYNDTDNKWAVIYRQNAGVELYYNTTVEAQTASGYLLANNQCRSPIFYDSGNTSYYFDGPSTTYAGYYGRRAHNTGHLVGSYNSVAENSYKSNPIYTIGSSYNPADATLSNMYGIGYTHGTNATFVSLSGAQSWGMYVAADGDARIFLDGSYGRILASGDLRVPLFYDIANTGYYCDPASTSNLNAVTCAGTIDVNGGINGIDLTSSSIRSAATSTWTGNPGAYGKIQYHSNRWYIVADSSSNRLVQFRRDSADKSYIDNDGRWYGTSDVRGTLFYDTNNTAYYCDPHSTSALSSTRHVNIVAGTTSALASMGQIGVYSSGSPYISFHSGTTSRTAYFQESGSRFYCGEVTYTESVGSFRSPLFYDVDNTGYYTDPASTSRMSQIQANTYYSPYNGSNSSLARSSYPYGWGFQETGGWSGTYPDLVLQYHTGVTLAGNASYNGITFKYDYNNDSIAFRVNGSSNYNYSYTWLQVNPGIYSGTNGAHFYANTASSYGSWYLTGTRGSYTGILFAGTAQPHLMFDSAGNGGFYNQNGGAWHYYYNIANSCVGINDSATSISYGLYVTGGIYSSAGNIYAASDARIKKDVKTIENALDKVLNLRGVTYIKTNKTEDDPTNGKTEMGVIAQEVVEVVPEVVNHAEDIDVYAVDYGNFAGLFIEAIKEQNEVINNLRQEVLNLKNQLGM